MDMHGMGADELLTEHGRRQHEEGEERPVSFCGLCDRPIWDSRDEYGPYLSARSLGVVCGDCAPSVTRGVL